MSGLTAGYTNDGKTADVPRAGSLLREFCKIKAVFIVGISAFKEKTENSF
jgi:hypothetical protein